jgi:Histidine kinase-, DNA gyrase B-, and HSP90-like ATPase.
MKASFKPRARLLKLLGDQLIGTPQLAVFELVKNSYDADAEKVEIVISNPEDKDNATIEITDFGGEGMTLDTITDVWLEPGADHREKQKSSGKRSKKHKRLPLGEKGVGRFAVHKLGQKITLITKAKSSPELRLDIDWGALDSHKYIDEAEIEIIQQENPEFFTDDNTGTRIIISKLNAPLTKAEVRRLHRNVQSIISPFEYREFKIDSKASDFAVGLKVEGHPEWTDDLLDMQQIIDQAIFKFTFLIADGKWSWFYEFTPTEALKKAFKVQPNKQAANDELFEFINKEYRDAYSKNPESFFDDLGPIMGEIYVFDFDAEVKKFYDEAGAIKQFLSENKGIRVYRDGIRVYNYGEPHDDWLEMDRSRVQRIAVNLNRDITVGAISLDLEKTGQLIEKTNREGFIENDAFRKLKAVTQSAIDKFQKLRLIDKDRLRAATQSDVKTSIAQIESPIEELKGIAEKKGWGEELAPTIKRIERSYNDMRDIMLTAGMAGLNMSVAFHEIHRGIKDTRKIIEAGKDISVILKQFERFELLLDTYANLLQKRKSSRCQFEGITTGQPRLGRSSSGAA